MINDHELDRPFSFGNGCEPDTSSNVPGNTSHGDSASGVIKRWLSRSGTKLPINATYLALGIGQAYPEVAFAKHLRIAPGRVTMVDRSISESTCDRVTTELSGVELVECGIFAYLTNPPKKDFSVVGAFGIEYIFERRNAPETFVSAMSQVVGKNGIVFINFYCGENIDSLWRSSGFEVVKGYEGSWSQQMYVNRS